jgi:hypothetical protein
MKKTIFVLLMLLILCHMASGQEFSFKMTFIDAIGNTDSLIMGYDIDATDSLDSEFGEINIIDSKLDSVFDVRITNEWKVRGWVGDQNKSKYHLKKQIVKKNCDTWADPMSIDIKCSHWPVTAQWNNNLFVGNPCREGSVFTSMHPGLWWDVITPSDLYYCILSDNTEVSFTSNTDDYFYPGDFGEDSYINSNHDTISVFWVAIGTNAIGVYIDQDSYDHNIVLSPNPSRDYIRLDFENHEDIKSIEIYDLAGRKQVIAIHDNEIDISKLISGFYYVKMTNGENRIFVKKFIKCAN